MPTKWPQELAGEKPGEILQVREIEEEKDDGREEKDHHSLHLPRSWSHFVGIYRQKTVISSKIGF